MPEITTPRDLFIHELGDILYVEQQLVHKALPKLIAEVQDEELKSALEDHLVETKKHVQNVKSAFELMGEPAEPEPCLAFEGLSKEHAAMVDETSADLIDIVDLGAAARTENYEIAAYEILRRLAKGLGEDEVVDLLDQNLQQEKDALRTVERIATRVANEHAKAIV